MDPCRCLAPVAGAGGTEEAWPARVRLPPGTILFLVPELSLGLGVMVLWWGVDGSFEDSNLAWQLGFQVEGRLEFAG